MNQPIEPEFPRKLVSITDETAYSLATTAQGNTRLSRSRISYVQVDLEAGELLTAASLSLQRGDCNIRTGVPVGQLRQLHRCNIHFLQ